MPGIGRGQGGRVDCLQGGPGLVELALEAEIHGGSSQVGPWWVDLAPTFSRKSLPPFVVDTWLQFNVHNNNINQVLISGWRQFWSLLWAVPVSSKIVVAVQCPLSMHICTNPSRNSMQCNFLVLNSFRGWCAVEE